MTPATEAELAEAVRAARGPLAIEGGGTRGVGHAVEGERLSTAGLSGITLYEPGALTLVVRAGTPLAEVKAALAAEGQMLPFEPWDARPLTGANGAPTVGGMVATNASGPRRVAAGACRDLMLGVRFVDGTGAVVKNGGRVMKNVTGLDLVKLMAGSHGTLGVLTEVSFKVLPRAETMATLVLEGLDADAAGRAMRAAMATPCDVTGAAHAGGRTMLRLEGFEASVAHRAKVLTAALVRFGTATVETVDWAALRDAAAFAGREGAVWRVSVRPSDGPAVGARLPEAEIVYDWAGGLLWVLAPEGLDVRTALAGMAGHATLVRGSDAAKARWGVFHPEPAPVAAVAAGLRARFDPRGILNRGRMGAAGAVAA
ncbi:MAG TPA: glycolate oxidase subunit GlcE [Amaricoccus sp.]|nr:glycolate oxidase subunit GlcE [Amaricoccus sp.]